jgi:hypothetical protein
VRWSLPHQDQPKPGAMVQRLHCKGNHAVVAGLNTLSRRTTRWYHGRSDVHRGYADGHRA